MKKTKILVLGIILAVSIASLSGCGNTQKKDQQEKSTINQQQQQKDDEEKKKADEEKKKDDEKKKAEEDFNNSAASTESIEKYLQGFKRVDYHNEIINFKNTFFDKASGTLFIESEGESSDCDPHFVQGGYDITKKIGDMVFSKDEIKEITYGMDLEMVDNKGQTSRVKVLNVKLTKERYKSIDWNVITTAEEMRNAFNSSFIHPTLKNELNGDFGYKENK